MLAALMAQAGADCVCFGIVRDEEALLRAAVVRALETCDLVLISGGSSVGAKDAACRVLESLGEVLFHGVAMKPGKPTLLGSAGGRPVLGLPGHPVAALFCAHLFACPLVFTLEGRRWRRRQVTLRRVWGPTTAGRSIPASCSGRRGRTSGRSLSEASRGSSPPWPGRTATSASPGTARVCPPAWRCPSRFSARIEGCPRSGCIRRNP
mgnify:CR=1 FL=1